MTLAQLIYKDLQKVSKETFYVVQGDVALIRRQESDEVFEELKTDTIKKGDNDHKIRGSYKILKNDKKLIVVVTGKAEIYHPQHTPPIKLSKGSYDVVFTMERDHFLEESREVID